MKLEQLAGLSPDQFIRATLSRPRGGVSFRKCSVQPVTVRGVRVFQFARYTEKQVFHENVCAEKLAERLDEAFAAEFSQLDLSLADADLSFRETKKGALLQNSRKAVNQAREAEHNRKKNTFFPRERSSRHSWTLGS